MGVYFTHAASERPYIDFGTVSGVQAMTTMSWMFWLNLDTDVATGGPAVYYILYQNPTSSTDESLEMFFNPNWANAGQFEFVADWSTQFGVWLAPKPSLHTDFLLTLTYDRSSTANNPKVYYNTTSKSVTRSTAPTGTYTTGTSNTIEIGGVSYSDEYAIGGTIKGLAVYNTIVSSAYIAAAVSAGASGFSTFLQQYDTGLVFRPPLNQADGLDTTSFVGATLTTSNKIRSSLGCVVGTPTGSPIGA